jgi:hypothetical protein
VADAYEVVSEAAIDGGYDPMSRLSLVRSGIETVGWTGFDMMDNDAGSVGNCTESIAPGSMLTANTAVLKVIDLFASESSHFFFVLDNNQITGTLHYNDLFKLPFRLCLFALTLELEQVALELALLAPRESWEVLSEPRRKKAIEVYQKRRGKPPQHNPFDELLSCTMFCDKGTIIWRRKLLPDMSRSRIESIFGKADRVRNACAHTNPEEASVILLERDQLRGFVCDSQAVIDLILNRIMKSP